MSDKDFVEQWVVLVREGEYEANGQKWAITAESITSMAVSFSTPVPIALSSDAFAVPGSSPPIPSSRCELIAVEVRRDGRGFYLAGLFRSPSICISFVAPGRDQVTGAPLGTRLIEAMFTDKKLSPIERATAPAASE